MDATYIRNPFTVLIDTAESQPWTFQGLHADADKHSLPLVVPFRYQSLGRHPDSRGDYSIDGLQDYCAIERKSMDDAISTVLGWDSQYHIERGINGRRERFKKELANLHAMPAAIVIVEATMGEILRHMPGCDGENYFDERTGEINATRGVKTVRENRKIFYRSVVSWKTPPRPGEPDLRVQWDFCETRREAEKAAFRWLEKCWQHLPKKERDAATQRAREAVGAI